MKRKTPGHTSIVLGNLALLGSLGKLEFDGGKTTRDEIERMTRTCWACGIESGTRKTRAHVVAAGHEGGDDPGNFFLLCNICHTEQPDGMPREAQVAWLRTREDGFVTASHVVAGWLAELEKIAGRRIGKKVVGRYLEDGGDEVIEAIEEAYRKTASWHNGRANARCALIEHFKGWLVNHPDEARARG